MTPSEKTFLVRQPFPIEETLNDLLEHACPAIRYRLRRELLNQSQMSAEMLALQNRILEDQTVKEVLSWQQPDGWIAWNFHGYHSMEAGIRILCEKGLDASNAASVRLEQSWTS
jgi:hypothetical protein